MNSVSFGTLYFIISALLCLPSAGYGQSQLQYAPDVPQAFQIYLDQSLTDFFQIQGTGHSPLHRQIFKGEVNGKVYRQWFLSRVRKIALTDNCGVTAKIDSEGEQGVIYISRCADLVPREEKKFLWLSILFHEARHLEPQSKYWKHGVCVDSSGLAEACDDSELAPFALEKVLSANIIHYCKNCKPEMIQQAHEVLGDPITWRKILPNAIDSLEKDLSFK